MVLLTAIILMLIVVVLLKQVVTVVAIARVAIDVDVIVCGDKGSLHWYFAHVPEALKHDAQEDRFKALVYGVCAQNMPSTKNRLP